MPKSRNRKNHKKKVAARNNRLRSQRNSFNKKLQELLSPKEVITEETIDNRLNEENNTNNID